MFKKIIPAIVGLAFSSGAALAHHPEGSASEFGHPGLSKDVTRTITLQANEYSFGVDTLTFKAGETIKFVVANKDRLKHELTIGEAAEQLDHRKSMEDMADMGHGEDQHEMPANSIHIPPGETRELIWTFTKPGKLEFACNYPGHADLGMEGRISVEQ